MPCRSCPVVSDCMLSSRLTCSLSHNNKRSIHTCDSWCVAYACRAQHGGRARDATRLARTGRAPVPTRRHRPALNEQPVHSALHPTLLPISNERTRTLVVTTHAHTISTGHSGRIFVVHARFPTHGVLTVDRTISNYCVRPL